MTKYNNPPIIEAVCEFKFAEDTNWDMTIPGILFGEIREEFPHKEQHLIQEINVLTKSAPAKTQIRKIELARFLNDNRTTLIQIGPRILSINQLKPYNTWSNFKSYIEYAFNKLNQTIELTAIQRIGLRYVNKIEIPVKGIDLANYFEFRPSFGGNLQRNYNSFILGCIFPFHGDQDSCKVELTGAVPESDDASGFMLDIDYSLVKPQSIPIIQSLEWVDRAHEEVEKVFEGCISSALRELFSEVK